MCYLVRVTRIIENLTKRFQLIILLIKLPTPTKVLGDSILKDVKGYKMKSATNHQANIYVKSFTGATVDDMDSYVLPSKKFNPDIVVLHFGTNDLKKKRTK